MENTSSTAELQVAIELLEAEQAVKLKLMKKQFHLAYESLRPVNLIENTLKEISTSPYLVNNLLNATVGLATGHLLKRVITGESNNKLRRFLGIVMQFGITNITAKILKHKRH
ncbi:MULTISPECIES: hypothetical protein [Maribellus]|uniref:Uncharacterized protein n=1 Tax=Maribellus comscasis TaxID=2681766 RepID=A0A6I6JY97_9BACT|nr:MULTISPECIES: hypothetical protein [Maribellus]MCG6190950.1 hypothetical protein [Maribellus maritimus]QGY46128.1 hypothetical protein GM418_21395 [Maribellus comscasis]